MFLCLMLYVCISRTCTCSYVNFDQNSDPKLYALPWSQLSSIQHLHASCPKQTCFIYNSDTSKNGLHSLNVAKFSGTVNFYTMTLAGV